MDTGSFPGVKRPGRGTDHPPPSKRRGHERVGLYLYSPSGPQWPVIGRIFTLTSGSILDLFGSGEEWENTGAALRGPLATHKYSNDYFLFILI